MHNDFEIGAHEGKGLTTTLTHCKGEREDVRFRMSTPATIRWAFSRCKIQSPSYLRRNLHLSRRLLGDSETTDADNSKLPSKIDPETPSDVNASVPAKRPRKKRKTSSLTAEDFKPYSDAQKEKLKQIYTPAQVAAIEAGEAAFDRKDLAQQATLREDPFAFEYVDDFSKILPVVDKAVKAPEENYDPKLRFKSEDEIAEDLANFIEDLPEEPTRLDYLKFRDQMRLTVGKEEAERNPRSSLAPEIPKGLKALRQPGTKVGEVDIDPNMKRLMKQTGFSLDYIKKFRVKNLVQHRVVNQTRMGKIQTNYYLTVAGNGKGLLGIGEGKAGEHEDARRQAHFNAIRNAQPIPRYEDRTIYGDVKLKVGAVEIELMTRPPGMYISGSLKVDLADGMSRVWDPMSRENI